MCERIFKLTGLDLPTIDKYEEAVNILKDTIEKMKVSNIAFHASLKDDSPLNVPVFTGENIRMLRHFVAWIEFPDRFLGAGFYAPPKMNGMLLEARNHIVLLKKGGPYFPGALAING